MTSVAAMPPEVRHPYLDLLIQTLTRTFTLHEGSESGRRHRRVAVVFALLARRGLTIVPALPAAGQEPVTALPGLPGAGRLLAALRRQDLVVVADPSVRSVLARSVPRHGRRSPWRTLDRSLARIEREFGLDWPEHAETMAGLRRLRNVEQCVTAAIRDGRARRPRRSGGVAGWSRDPDAWGARRVR